MGESDVSGWVGVTPWVLVTMDVFVMWRTVSISRKLDDPPLPVVSFAFLILLRANKAPPIPIPISASIRVLIDEEAELVHEVVSRVSRCDNGDGNIACVDRTPTEMALRLFDEVDASTLPRDDDENEEDTNSNSAITIVPQLPLNSDDSVGHLDDTRLWFEFLFVFFTTSTARVDDIDDNDKSTSTSLSGVSPIIPIVLSKSHEEEEDTMYWVYPITSFVFPSLIDYTYYDCFFFDSVQQILCIDG